ncbi:MAG TPA: NrfD/PsrC family molybdoenzyme membrane anchor subunit [Candidatus Limnocylindrales bacterium]|nr:NrfD/PsrC family molybdoenzyme membrane anchor subunit [Candidatus Limnocylindrales bacterium]
MLGAVAGRLPSLDGRSVTLGGRTLPLAPRAAVAAVVGEITSMPRGLRLWFAFLLGVCGLAAIAALIALPPGWEVFGTTPSFEWGLLIIGYVFFAITTSGLCLASSLGTVFGIERFRPLEKRHAILALLCLIAAFGIIALDLHYPVRMVFGAMFVPSPSSPMWWMGVFYGVYLVVLVVEVWSMFTHHPRIHQAACTMAAGTAIVAPATLGAVFGVLVARPFWHGPFTPVLMVATAFLSGVALLAVVFFAVARLRLAGSDRVATVAMPAIRLLLGVGLVVVSLLVARHVAAGLSSDRPGYVAATEALLFGPLAAQFWGVRVAIGLALPIVLLVLPRTRTVTGTFVAGLGAIIGVFADRFTFVAAGQIAPTTSVSGTVSSPFAGYTPSPVEVLIVLGAAAFVALGYTLAERYLDLGESDDHIGGSLAAMRGALRRLPRPRVDLVATLRRRGPAGAEARPAGAETRPTADPGREPEAAR